MSAAPIRFCDVARINAPYAEEIEAAVARVIAGGSLILGDEVRAFERDVEHFLGVRHAIGVGTGTDALTLSLIACGVGVGDEVLVPSFTYFAAVEAIRWSEATPRLLDVNELGDVRMEDIDGGAKTKACILPSLYGRATPIDEGIRRHSSNKIAIIEDACQAFGAMTAGGRFAGTRGVAGCFSFYPTKVLGAAGDGGMVVRTAIRSRKQSAHFARMARSQRTNTVMFGWG